MRKNKMFAIKNRNCNGYFYVSIFGTKEYSYDFHKPTFRKRKEAKNYIKQNNLDNYCVVKIKEN